MEDELSQAWQEGQKEPEGVGLRWLLRATFAAGSVQAILRPAQRPSSRKVEGCTRLFAGLLEEYLREATSLGAPRFLQVQPLEGAMGRAGRNDSYSEAALHCKSVACSYPRH